MGGGVSRHTYTVIIIISERVSKELVGVFPFTLFPGSFGLETYSHTMQILNLESETR